MIDQVQPSARFRTPDRKAFEQEQTENDVLSLLPLFSHVQMVALF
jgi:hypothetical protein